MKELLFDRWKAYLMAQTTAARTAESPRCAIAISRETGAGGVTVAQLVADSMQERQHDQTTCPWAVFDRHLVEKVLKDKQAPKKFLRETAAFELKNAAEELLGLHPSSWTVVQQTSDAVLKLATRGNVVIVGRGAHVITAHLPHVLHVRLIAPEEHRIRKVAAWYRLNPTEAGEFVTKTDRARRRYVMWNFNSRIDDPLAYHLVINTGRVSYEEAARIIADAALRKQPTHPPRAGAAQA